MRLTANDLNEIEHIAARAVELASEAGIEISKADVKFPLAAVHLTTPLRLRELRLANNGDFGHDVFGIMQNFNPQANGFEGGLENCFSPRYSL